MSNRKHGNRIFAEMAMRMAFFCVILIMGTMFVHADTKQGAYELQTYKQETTIQKDHQYDVTLEMTINAPKVSAAFGLTCQAATIC